MGTHRRSYGESPYGVSVFAEAAVHGYQGETLNLPTRLPVLSSILWLTEPLKEDAIIPTPMFPRFVSGKSICRF